MPWGGVPGIGAVQTAVPRDPLCATLHTMEPAIIAPSILAADFTDIRNAIEVVEGADAPWIHLDVMDGHFVPNISFGSQMVQDIRTRTSRTLDVHLMVSNPQDHIAPFAHAGADLITVHLEASVHLHRLLGSIRDLGVGAGVAVVPSTPVSSLMEVLSMVDLVVVMTVNPGFGGQKLIPATLEKVRRLAEIRREGNLAYRISVDGGINGDTAAAARNAGADVLVMGSAFFSAQEPHALVRQFT